jgi:hypothetical protein
MPDGYGVPEGDAGLLEWAVVEARLVEAPHYWMATTRPDGRPHVVPRWGAWLDGALHYDGSPDTVHAVNARSNPACTLHIGDGREAISLEGTTAASPPVPPARGATIAAEIGRKYGAQGYRPEPDAWSDEAAGGLMIFTPTKALAWFDFPNDLTRFHFAPPTAG